MTDVATAPAPLSRMRRAVVRTVTASAAVPQYSVEVEADATAARAALGALREGTPRASLGDLVHYALARSLLRHPRLNSSFTEEGVLAHPRVNLAFLLEHEDGLLAPTILGAEARPLADLVAERIRLTDAARAGTLTAEELTAATFTVSNLGPAGVRRFTAMVLPPQAAVLALGGISLEGRLSLTLSCDHRVVDGAPAARFLGDVRALLEDADALAAAVRGEA